MLTKVTDIEGHRSPPPLKIAHQRSVGAGRLHTKQVGNRTSVQNLYQSGCAKIRLPRTAGDALQAVMINSSGGMTGGDRLSWEFSLGKGDELTVTSQACERVYASTDGEGRSEISLNVSDNARLNWLPQETILFDRGSLKRQITVNLEATSELLMVEPVIFGRGAMDEVVTHGRIADRWRIHRSGSLMHAEDMLCSGSINDILKEPAVASGAIAIATVLLIAPRAQHLCEKAVDLLGATGSASYWNDKLLCRMMAPDGYHLRKKLIPLLQLLNQDQRLPKVWAL